MLRIRLLQGEWYYDPNSLLGPEGGFGVVFAGTADGFGLLAIKKIKLEAKDTAHRELRIAEELAGRQLVHVMSVLDSGQDAESDSYFVVMPRAEKSLQDEIRAKQSFTDIEAAEIMLQIAIGLSEVSQIVHRDLKPGNVLYHDGKWKVADFGIARFVEESTSLRTLKGCLTPQYAAPEQWRLEHSTPATDIYALGCIGYALLTGEPPFAGPVTEDFKEQHLHGKIPRLEISSARLRSLLSMMLRKPPESRPNLARVKDLLSEIANGQDEASPGAGLDALSQVGAVAAERAAEQEAKQALEKSKRKRKHQIAIVACEILEDVIENLFERTSSALPTAEQAKGAVMWYINSSEANLVVDFTTTGNVVPENSFRRSGWDVITVAVISVIQERPSYRRSALLLYADSGQGENAYRWYELSYFAPFSPPASNVPFALKNFADADEGIAGGGRYQIASGPYPIDDEDIDDFCNRWAEILAKACQGKLEHPRYLPLDR